MGKVNLSALRVRQSAIAQLANGKTTKTPCWLDITADVPPAGVLTRNPVIPHQLERQRVRVRNDPKTGTGVWQTVVTAAKKPQKKRSVRDATRPQELVYEEDELRRRFYRDHPWELARPRVILENRGNDYRRYDWSKLLQPNKRLDGESVIQRQLWLLHNVPAMTKRKAYDIARNEFYAARLKEELERSVAHEEALACGARFGPGMLAVGQQLESAAYDRWKAWAEQELMVQEARLAAFAGDTTAGLGDGDADGDAAAKALETEDQLAMGAVEGPPAPQRKKPTLSSMMTA